MLVKNLFGHDDIANSLLKMLQGSHLHNSIIFSGKKGIGKYSYVLFLAKFLLSHDIDTLKTLPTFSIDSKINSLVDNNSCPDLLLITPEFDTKKQVFKDLINVEAVRKINDFLQKTGSANRYKIVIIDEADSLNTAASNALLKNLEEPTTNTLFFLISHSYNNLLDTIKSRCINLAFKDLTKDSMLNILNLQQIAYSPDKISNLINMAQGSYADLLWYLNDNNFKIYEETLKIFNNAVVDKDILNLVNTIKAQENFNYSYVFTIIKNYLAINNSDMLDEVSYLENTSQSLYLDKSAVLLNIFFKIKSLHN
ncbi:MAG: AAA family ATPase [Alphaproteobacteria bacterium]|jgi:DNA polymerase-3 subunit delta'|nr:AAA family ATPase [Alphaproteobacteria bacterium]